MFRIGQCCLRLRYRQVPNRLDFSADLSATDQTGSGGDGGDNSAYSVSNPSYTGEKAAKDVPLLFILTSVCF